MTDPTLFKLGSVLTSYPTDESFVEAVKLLIDHCEVPGVIRDVKLEGTLLELSPGALPDLRSDYIDLFDRGRAANPIYETEYGRDRLMAKGNDLADIAAFYKAFGLAWDEGEMLDHIAIELEFYGWLCLKSSHLQEVGDAEGLHVVREARRKFLADHLGPFVTAIADRPAIQVHSFYGPVFQFCARIVADECHDLGLEVEPLTYLPGQKEGEAMCCGGLKQKTDD